MSGNAVLGPFQMPHVLLPFLVTCLPLSEQYLGYESLPVWKLASFIPRQGCTPWLPGPQRVEAGCVLRIWGKLYPEGNWSLPIHPCKV